jgi:hypothetical protein
MNSFISNLIYSFFIAFGVMLGATSFAGVAAFINDSPPLKTMLDVASSVKIWAVATALGGTFTSFEVFEGGIFRGEVRVLTKQILYILSALLGANMGFRVVKLIQRCGQLWIG